jgi:hypothetical protein
VVATFGGRAKNPAPKTTARQYVNAIQAGTTAERIQDQAQAQRNTISEEKYMPMLATWLEGQGYLTPDLPKSEGARASKSPAHRSNVDEAYLEDLAKRRADAIPPEDLSDEDMNQLLGRTS